MTVPWLYSLIIFIDHCQFNWVGKSLLLTCKTLGLLVNRMPADEKYPVLYRDNSTIPIQMQLSQKQESFPQLFSSFLKSTLNFEYFEKKMTVRAFVFPKLGTPQTWLDKRVKSLVWEDSLISNMVNVLKHWWNLHHSTFIIFIDHC